MRHKVSVSFFVVMIAIYSIFALFIFAPLFDEMLSRSLLILLMSFFLLTAHLIYCYVLRKEHPLIWMIEYPIVILLICFFSCIKSSFFVNSLEFYGIYSIYSEQTDPVLTAVPFYIDAFLFASVILSARVAIFIPFYYASKDRKKET